MSLRHVRRLFDRCELQFVIYIDRLNHYRDHHNDGPSGNHRSDRYNPGREHVVHYR
jgi:hypothetical protein